MRMSDVRVGMRFRDPSDYHFEQRGVLTVTELTARGFKYDAERSYLLSPRLGVVQAKGNEHYGVQGECLFDLLGDSAEETKRAMLIAHVGCGDVDNMGHCSQCDAIRAYLLTRGLL